MRWPAYSRAIEKKEKTNKIGKLYIRIHTLQCSYTSNNGVFGLLLMLNHNWNYLTFTYWNLNFKGTTFY